MALAEAAGRAPSSLCGERRLARPHHRRFRARLGGARTRYGGLPRQLPSGLLTPRLSTMRRRSRWRSPTTGWCRAMSSPSRCRTGTRPRSSTLPRRSAVSSSIRSCRSIAMRRWRRCSATVAPGSSSTPNSFRGYDFGAMLARIRPDLPRLAHAFPGSLRRRLGALLAAGARPRRPPAARRSAGRQDGALHLGHDRPAEGRAAQPRHAHPRRHHVRAPLGHSGGRRHPDALAGHPRERLFERTGDALPRRHAQRVDGDTGTRRTRST